MLCRPRLAASALATVLLSACAVPDRPVLSELEIRDQSFAEPRQARNKAEALLKKDELTLEDVLRIADIINPSLEIERREVDLAPLGAWDASLFPNPELGIEVEDFPTGSGRSLTNSERTISLSQSLPVGGRLGAAATLSGKSRELAAYRFFWMRRELLTQVKSAFLDVLSSRQNVELTRQTRDLAKQFHDLTEDRFKAQAIPEMEVLKAAVNLAKAESDLRAAEKDRLISIKTLHSLMGDVDFPTDRFQGNLFDRFEAPSLESLRGQAIVGHPMIEVAKREKEVAEAELTLAHTEAVPDVELDLGYGWTADDERIVEFGLSFPLQLFNRNRGAIMAARIRIRQTELRMQEVRNVVVLSLIEAYRNFEAAQGRVTTYKQTIMPKAEKALAQTDEGYKAGKFSYLDVLDSQQTLAEARIAYLAALVDLNRFAAELEKVTGSRLKAVQ